MQTETNFYFDEWASLAKADPEAFEIRRRRTIDEFLMGSPSRQRLLGTLLQREIDYQRKRADCPHEAFQVIARMLCVQLVFLGEGVTSVKQEVKRVDCLKIFVERCVSNR